MVTQHTIRRAFEPAPAESTSLRMAPRPPRASDEHLQLFATIKNWLFVRQNSAPLRGRERFDASQAAMQEIGLAYDMVLAAEGADLLSESIGLVIPPEGPWTADGVQGEFDAVGLHFPTLWWKLAGNLRKLGTDGKLVGLPWDFLFRNFCASEAEGRARARKTLMWNCEPVSAVHDAGNPLVHMNTRVPGLTQLIKALIHEALEAVGLPRRVLTCGAQVRASFRGSRGFSEGFLPSDRPDHHSFPTRRRGMTWSPPARRASGRGCWTPPSTAARSTRRSGRPPTVDG